MPSTLPAGTLNVTSSTAITRADPAPQAGARAETRAAG